MLLFQALKVAHAGISLSEAEASVASPFTSKVCLSLVISDICFKISNTDLDTGTVRNKEKQFCSKNKIILSPLFEINVY